MKHNNWINAIEAEDKYQIPRNTAYSQFFLKAKWVKKDSGRTFVNISFLIRVQAFRDRLQTEAEHIYFEFEKDYEKLLNYLVVKTGRTRSNWNTFLSMRLFALIEQPLSRTYVSVMLYEFVKYGRKFK